jgi:glycosyltransferase involved in cell wall biosynthesis
VDPAFGMTARRPFLLDVTRLFALGWANKKPTGIDRVCLAYLRHYRHRAHAVLQHRGVFRVLTEKHSDNLFGLLNEPVSNCRRQLNRMVPSILFDNAQSADSAGKVYLNVGHTDFDLPSHWQWIRSSGVRSFYMVHDLIPINHPDFTTPHAVRRHLGRVNHAMRQADGVITNSNSTLAELREFAAAHDLSLPPTLPAPLGTDHLAGTFQSPRKPNHHFVYVSTIEPRKNHLLLLRVWQSLIAKSEREPPKLVLIGQWGTHSEPVRQMLHNDPRLSQHVTVLDNCEDADMVAWISSSKAVLLPSTAEGYGLPLAEAMAMRIPVIATDLPCFREIGNTIPMLVPANEESAWETAITEFLRKDDEADRQRALLSSHQPRRWSDHFRLVDDWIASERSRVRIGSHVNPSQPETTNLAAVKTGAGELKQEALQP